MGEASLIIRIAEVGLDRGRPVAGAEPKVLVHAIGLDDLPRIHAPPGIPDRLELPEGLDHLGAEHLGEELGLGLTIAVLPR